MGKSVEILSAILDCLPDKNQTASRLLFSSMVTVAKEAPKESVEFVIQGIDLLPKQKHEGKV